MRRNSNDDSIRALERRLAAAPDDATAIMELDQVLGRLGPRERALYYAKRLADAWVTGVRDPHERPEGFRVETQTPDGVRPDGIQLSLTRRVDRRRELVPDAQGRRTLSGPFVEVEVPYVQVEAHLLPGPSAPGRCYKCGRERSEQSWSSGDDDLRVAHCTGGTEHVLGSTSASDVDESMFHPRPIWETSVFRDASDVPGGVAVLRPGDERPSDYNLVRDEEGELLRVIGWSPRELWLALASEWLKVREEAARRFDRARALRDSSWKAARRELARLARRAVKTAPMRRDADGTPYKDVSSYYQQAASLLALTTPEPLEGYVTRPLNAAGEAWAVWSAGVLARALADKVYLGSGIATATELPWLWSRPAPGPVSATVFARSRRRPRTRLASVRITFPQTMEFVRLLSKAEGKAHVEDLESYVDRYPPEGRFEVESTAPDFARLVEATIRDAFPKAMIVRRDA